jgi:asparagine synthase (glutamine-hydrolysing)
MAGVSGIFGEECHRAETLLTEKSPRSNQPVTSWAGYDVSVAQPEHSGGTSIGPVECSDGLLWLWGIATSDWSNGGYRNKHEVFEGLSSAEYVGKIVSEEGIDSIRRINGQYSGIYIDLSTNIVSIFTDRLGSHPLYYHDTGDSLIVSSDMHALIDCVDPITINDGGICEFMTLGRILGTHTPVQEVESVAPSSVYKYDLESKTLNSTTYWRPEYNPLDRPADYFAKRLNEILEETFAGFFCDDLSYGLLLSGGSDSRLLANFLPSGAGCYHMNGYMNREAEAAADVAAAVDAEFIFLPRSDDHYDKVLRRGGEMNNFSSWFEQGHVLGYDNLEFSDVMLTGQFSDTLLGGYHYPNKKISIPFVDNPINAPVPASVQDLHQYISYWENGQFGRCSRPPTYLNTSESLASTLSNNICSSKNVVSHGVDYGSLENLIVSHCYYPITNAFTSFMYESMNQISTCFAPFLDYRVIDLALKIPVKQQLRGKIVERAIKKSNKRLSRVKYPKTGLSLNRHPYLHYIKRLSLQLAGSEGEGERDFCRSRSPWVNHSELIRSRPFLINYIKDNEELLRRLPFIDYEDVVSMWNKHRKGQNYRRELYAVATLVSMPSVEHFIQGE